MKKMNENYLTAFKMEYYGKNLQLKSRSRPDENYITGGLILLAQQDKQKLKKLIHETIISFFEKMTNSKTTDNTEVIKASLGQKSDERDYYSMSRKGKEVNINDLIQVFHNLSNCQSKDDIETLLKETNNSNFDDTIKYEGLTYREIIETSPYVEEVMEVMFKEVLGSRSGNSLGEFNLLYNMSEDISYFQLALAGYNGKVNMYDSEPHSSWYQMLCKNISSELLKQSKSLYKKSEGKGFSQVINHIQELFNLNEQEMSILKFSYVPHLHPSITEFFSTYTSSNNWQHLHNRNQDYFENIGDISPEREDGRLISNNRNDILYTLKQKGLVQLDYSYYTGVKPQLNILKAIKDEDIEAIERLVFKEISLDKAIDFNVYPNNQINNEINKILNNKENPLILVNGLKDKGSFDYVKSLLKNVKHNDITLLEMDGLEEESLLNSFVGRKETLTQAITSLKASIYNANKKKRPLVIKGFQRLEESGHDKSGIPADTDTYLNELKNSQVPVIIIKENSEYHNHSLNSGVEVKIDLALPEYEVKELTYNQVFKELKIFKHFTKDELNSIIKEVSLGMEAFEKMTKQVLSIFDPEKSKDDFIQLLKKKYLYNNIPEFTEIDNKISLDLSTFTLDKDDVEICKQLMKTKATNILIKTRVGRGADEFINALGKEYKKNVLMVNLMPETSKDNLKENNKRIKKALTYAEANGKIVVLQNLHSSLSTNIGLGANEEVKIEENREIVKLLSEHNTICFCLVLPEAKMREELMPLFGYSLEFLTLSFKQRKALWDFILNKDYKYDVDKITITDLAKSFNVERNQIHSAIKTTQKIIDPVKKKIEFIDKMKKIIKKQEAQTKNSLIKNEFNADRYSLDGVNADTNLTEVIMASKEHYNSITDPNVNLEGEPSQNILMFGQAGTGKTEFAHYLAHSIDAPLIVLKASDLIGFMPAITLANIKNAFKLAEMEQAVLLIDEADSLFCDRYDPESPEHKKTITNELLTQMESFKGIFICSTNLKGVLDPASLRRFVFKIKFDYLHLEARVKFYNIFLADLLNDELSKEDKAELELLRDLSIGDFKVVHQQFKRSKKKFTHKDLIQSLRKEMEEKLRMNGSKVLPLNQKNYDVSCINTNYNAEKIAETVKKYYKALMHNDENLDIPNRNMLFYGIAGSGKTEFAKYLAHSVGARLMVVKGSDIKGKYVGETEANLKKRFLEAEDAGAVLLFDEADGVIKNRNNESGHGSDLTNELLTHLENFKGICILSTNYKSAFDEATLRRLTYKVKFDYITNEAKTKFFNIFLKKLTGKELTQKATKMLHNIDQLVAGDFKVIHDKYFFDKGEEFLTNEYLIAELEAEVAHRKPKKMGLAG